MVVSAAMLAFSCVTLAQTAPSAGAPKSPAPASTHDIAGVWLGDGAGNNRALLSQAAATLMQPWATAKFNAQGVASDPDPGPLHFPDFETGAGPAK